MKLDDTSPGALSAPGDVFMDGLLLDLLPIVEGVIHSTAIMSRRCF
jgi:hypothetical protein